MGRTWESRKDDGFKSKPKTLKPGRRARPEEADDYDWRKDPTISETDEKITPEPDDLR
jgi:hypothetical protein